MSTSMLNARKNDRFAWWFSGCTVGCGTLAFLPLTLASSDAAVMLYLFIAVPIISFILLLIAFRRRRIQRLAALLAFSVFIIFTAALFRDFSDIRNASRWFVYAKISKAEVLAQPDSSNGQLKHAEWEGWGFPGAGDTVVYLVFDPKDSLAAAAKTRSAGKFSSLPCEVFRVRRLETQWYAVQFYTEADWDHCT